MPAQTTPKEAIAEALQSLDHANNTLWTDDGAPLVAEVARICNDKTITRAQINDALPGFARKTQESNVEEVQPDDEPEDVEADELDEFNEPKDDINASPPAADTELSPEEEYQRLRAIAMRRVDDAQEAVTAAKNKVAAAVREVAAAENRHTRALQLFSQKYPPLTTAENIQQHLRRQQEILRERVTGSRFEPNVAQNPVDATLMDRKRDNGRNNNKGARFLPLSTGG